MPTNDQDARALTYLAGRLRAETHGCREWDEAGIFAIIKAELGGKNLAHAIESVLCHATDPEAKTPGALRRNFIPPKPSEKPKERAVAPKRHEECPKHAGQWATACGGCAADKRVIDDDPPSPDLPPVADVNPRLAKRLAEMRSER